MKYIRSSQSIEDFLKLRHILESVLMNASEISSFNFKEGHPFYPVFWDYSYKIVISDKTYILVGSSSD
ncbi:MAG: hypothetical protein HRU38_26345 [Saccharospirillaceae bacterium]|nr:hypothetical protein [Saccharospirillaceae bacterium]